MARGRRKAQAENGSDPRARKQIISVDWFSLRTCVFIYIYKSVGGCRRVGSLNVSPYDLYKRKTKLPDGGR